jgi:hypothetical protein
MNSCCMLLRARLAAAARAAALALAYSESTG